MGQFEASLDPIETIIRVIHRDLLGRNCAGVVRQMLRDRRDAAFEIGRAHGQLTNLVFDAIQRRLKALKVLEHEILDFVCHDFNPTWT